MNPAASTALPVIGQRSPVREPRTGGVARREEPGRYPVPLEQRTGPLWDALREVMDPEIPISLVDLGLIYDLRLEAGTAEVDLTFTATACPCMVFIRHDIEERLLQADGVERVRIHEVWNPPWSKDRISPEGREQLKRMGVGM